MFRVFVEKLGFAGNAVKRTVLKINTIIIHQTTSNQLGYQTAISNFRNWLKFKILRNTAFFKKHWNIYD